MKNKLTALSLVLIVLSLGSYLVYRKSNSQKPILITSFEECTKAGYPVMESFPEQCKGPEGKIFTNVATAQNITVTGEIVCLPHKDQEGPQTLECAFGIKDPSGQFYALSDPDFKYLGSIPTGETVTVEGTLKQPQDSIYNIVGVIDITSVSK